MNSNEGGRLSRPFVTDPHKFDPSKFYVPQEWYLYSQLFSTWVPVGPVTKN